MGIGVPGGGVCGPDTRLQSLGANPSPIGLDFASFLLDAGEKVEPRFACGEIKHSSPLAGSRNIEEEAVPHHNRQ